MMVHDIRKMFFIFLFSCLVSLEGAYCQEKGRVDSTVEVNLTIKGNDTTGPYFLPDYHILLHSEVMIREGLVMQRGDDYEIDYNQGIVNFRQSLASQDSARITYAKLSFRLKKEYCHRQIIYFQSKPPSSVFLESWQSVPVPWQPTKGGSRGTGLYWDFSYEP